jgi:DNA-directed RNA polymerase subunit beta'
MDLSRGTLGERGLAVGIIAAQSIGEPGTQLTMRTFHIGGTASRAVEESEVRAKRDGTARFTNLRSVVNRLDETVVLNRNAEIILVDERGRELDRYAAPMGAVLLVQDGAEVKTRTTLCRWDPHHVPILGEFDGRVRFEDLIEGKTLKMERDSRGGVRKQIIEHKGDLHPQLILEDSKGQALALYPIPERAYIEVEDGQEIRAGDLLAKSAREIGGTQDITGGLPRVTELFEARRPKDPSVISEIDGLVELGEKKRGKRTIIVRAIGPKGEVIEEQEHAVPQGKHLRVHKGDEVKAGDPLVDGPLVPHDILRIKGEEAVQDYLLREIQNVYRSQGVTIDDKHIEIILGQMMRKVQVTDPGDSEFLPGAVVDKFRFRRENEKLRKDRKKPANGQTLLLGVTKASLSSESFISAASFQETTKVLTEAAIAGRRDFLVGLKENVILGHMVPTGTGFRDHYRTRVKKNIDFGEIGKTAALSPAAMDAQMEALLSGEFDALSAEERASSLARTGTEAGVPGPLEANLGGALEDEDEDRDELLPAVPPDVESEPPVDPRPLRRRHGIEQRVRRVLT